MVEPQPTNITEALVQILNNQQALMRQIYQQLATTQLAVKNLSRDESVLDSLSSNMAEFVYDKDNGHTFDAWFSRYVDLFDKDAGKLDDAAKVRLLLRKLSPPEHERYNSFILPKLTREFTFAATVEKLKSLFGATVSTFQRRYNCLQTTKEDSDDYLAYSCKVNKTCVDFKLSELTEEQFKCLIYGLKSKQEAEIRMRLINKLNESVDLTLQQIVEQCNSLVNLKQDTVMVESCSSTVKAVAYPKRTTSKRQSPSDCSNNREQPKTPCWSCGGMHYNKDCRFRDHRCNECGKYGHREGYCACFSSKSSNNAVNRSDNKKKRRQPLSKIVTVRSIGQRRKFVEIQLNNVPLRLQLDTSSDISIISHRSWARIGRPKVKPAICSAKTASGEPLELVAELECNINLNGIIREGIDWMDLFGLWDHPIASYCNQVTTQANQRVATLQAQFPEVFSSEIGLCNKTPVKLVLKGNPKPVFRPKRPVAYSMEHVVEVEIFRLQNLGIPMKVDFSDWAAPIVAVRKPNGTVRICADFSTGLNSVLEPNQYPLPLPEDIFAKMANCRICSHIDLSDAYLQVEVDQASQPLLTINTHKGLFQVTRLSPGIKSAPGAFQQLMDTMLAGLNCTLTLARLKEYGFTVRIEKCSFGMQQVKYLGQILDGNGIRPDPEKIASIVSMPPPHDVSTLRSYLGAVNYYGKYVKEMRTLRHPMDQLLKAGVKFEWSPACQASFDRFREILQSPLLLTHYNPMLDIIVSADASALGLGARIAHQLPDGTIKAICHVSRSLTTAETNYSQIEKEGLAIVFAEAQYNTLSPDTPTRLSRYGAHATMDIYISNMGNYKDGAL
ncbi:uncharacterized protein K02A2.6-like [Ochlerotatus camptorhynchus]|uniref:uncharacterized protein K02A2.6-like n=1 Tax=Ochlerotatus camptorhynchus TaxID=644619 RepID=UPI0031D36072